MKFYLNKPLRRQFAGGAVAATIAIILAACGGSNNDQVTTTSPVIPPMAAPPSVPASAVVDVAAFVGYLNGLATNDNQEPLLADAVTPPTNDTSEPIII